ncbi:polysaccharide pyruvyl transferase family protein [Clostridium baratii]
MKKRVALYGIGGLYNYGCEAIVRGAVANIRKIDSNCKITYYSKYYEYDKKQIEDLNIDIVNIESKSNILKKIINKLIDVFNVPIIPFNRKEYMNVIENNDIIMSIGGDIYSIPKYKRNKKTYRYVNKMVEFGELAKQNNKNLIIYGASIGPFGEYSKAKKYFVDHLNKLDLIVCREQYSIEYLKENGIEKNVIFLPDPAYLVGGEENLDDNKEYLGINLSGLSLHEIYGAVNLEAIKKICKLLEHITLQLDLPIMLIPHVYSPFDKLDNDYEFLKEVYQNLPDEIKENVKLVKPNSFLDVKKYLKKCKIVIAARMHCAVNAIIETIPTIFLSYSIKSQGMSQFIYGNLKWFVSLDSLENKLINLVKEINENSEIINKELISKKREINKYFNINNEEYNKLRKIIIDERE